jgi:hypothetical protein
MRVLAIDPGNQDSAYVIWDGERLHGFGKVPNATLRQMLRDWVQLVDQTRMRVVAIEMIASYGMAVGKEVFETCVAIGRFVEICEQSGITPQIVYRQEEKLHHCRSVKANDATIRRALMDRFGDKGTKRNPGFFYGFVDDVWAAFGIAALVVDRANGLQAAPISKANIN